MRTYLVEYEMLWAGKTFSSGIEEIEAFHNLEAEGILRDRLKKVNKKAEIKIIESVQL